MRGFWETEPRRAAVGLCPNCLAERIGALRRPHAEWCSVLRRVRAEELETAAYLVAI